MGHIFDIHSARLYEKWYSSIRGMVMESFVERLVSELLSPIRNERVLDLGCGSGNHLLLLNRLGLNISGLDPSPYMLDLARKRLGNRCELKKGKAEDIPYDDNEFDYVLLINTLEFLDNPLEALREAGRVARKKVLIVVINYLSWSRVCEILNGIITRSISTYIRSYNLWRLRSLVRKAYGHVPVSWQSAPMSRMFQSRSAGLQPDLLKINKWPFGYYLGLSVTVEYRIKTDNLPIKRRIENAEHPVVGGVSPVSNLKNEII